MSALIAPLAVAPRLVELAKASREVRSVICRLAGHDLHPLPASLTGQRDKMIAAYELAVRLEPSNSFAHFILGTYVAEAGRRKSG